MSLDFETFAQATEGAAHMSSILSGALKLWKHVKSKKCTTDAHINNGSCYLYEASDILDKCQQAFKDEGKEDLLEPLIAESKDLQLLLRTLQKNVLNLVAESDESFYEIAVKWKRFRGLQGLHARSDGFERHAHKHLGSVHSTSAEIRMEIIAKATSRQQNASAAGGAGAQTTTSITVSIDDNDMDGVTITSFSHERQEGTHEGPNGVNEPRWIQLSNRSLESVFRQHEEAWKEGPIAHDAKRPQGGDVTSE